MQQCFTDKKLPSQCRHTFLSDSDIPQQLLAELVRCRVTVDQLPTNMLPDNVLLENFAFYVGQEIEAWQCLCTCVNDSETFVLDRRGHVA
jgi:hypothetical protein